MGLILVSTGPSRTRTFLSICNSVLIGHGYEPVANLEEIEGGDPLPRVVVQVKDAVNMAYEDLLDRAGARFNHSTGYADMEPGEIWYDAPSGFLNIEGDPFIEGVGQLDFENVDFLEQGTGSLEMRGQPRLYTIWNEKVGIFPPPSEQFLRNRYVYAGGLWYVCIKSTRYLESPTEPSGDGDDNWATTEVVPGDEADFAWDASKLYLPGRFTLRLRLGATLLAANGDQPILPGRFLSAMILGAKAQLSVDLKEDKAMREDRQDKYDRLLARLIQKQTPTKTSARPHDPNPI